MNDRSARRRPAMRLPVQALPVWRDDQPGPAARAEGTGVQAAQSRCSSTRGLARQLCYARQYGVSV